MTRKPSLILLTGLMGSGKTSLAQEISKRMKIPLWDSDALVERRSRRRIVVLFRDFGEHGFRRWERTVFRDLLKQRRGVIATGGGLLCSCLIRRQMGRSRHIRECWLRASPQSLTTRLGSHAQLSTRPLLADGDIASRLQSLERKRFWYYNRASFQVKVDGLAPEQVASILIRVLRKNPHAGRRQRLSIRLDDK